MSELRQVELNSLVALLSIKPRILDTNTTNWKDSEVMEEVAGYEHKFIIPVLCTPHIIKPVPLILITIVSATLFASKVHAQEEIYGSNMAELMTKMAEQKAKWAQEEELAKNPKSRAPLVSSLVLTLRKGTGIAPSEQADAWQRPLEQFDAWRLALSSLNRLKIAESYSEIVEFSDVNAYLIKPWLTTSFPSEEDTHPAYGAIRYAGKIGIPIFVQALAQQKRSDDFTRVAVQAIDEIANPRRFYFATSGRPVFEQYAQEYEQKSVRLHMLEDYLGETKEGEALGETKVPIEVPTLFASDNESRVAQILEWHYTLTDQLASSTEIQVLAAISEAQKLKAFELAPDLCDKLDPAPLPKVNNVMAAEPKGRLSPASADASEAALRSMGQDALPALLDAVSMAGRSPQFRQKAMTLILAAAGDEASARAALEAAAKANDERAARLRAIIEIYNKPVAK